MSTPAMDNRILSSVFLTLMHVICQQQGLGYISVLVEVSEVVAKASAQLNSYIIRKLIPSQIF